jgi:uncharacterized protein
MKSRLTRWIFFGALFFLFFLSGTLINLYIDWLWFKEVFYESVFFKIFTTELVTGCLAFLVFFGFLYLNLLFASRYRSSSVRVLDDGVFYTQQKEMIKPYIRPIILWGSVFIALMSGLRGKEVWEDFLLFLNATDFQSIDPLFNKDLGFYIFQLPFIEYIHISLSILTLLTVIFVALLYILQDGIHLNPQDVHVGKTPKIHLMMLVGLFLFLKAWGYKIGMFNLLLYKRGIIFGAGYADIYGKLPVLKILLFLSIAAGISVMIAGFRSGWKIPLYTIGSLILVHFLGAVFYPQILQNFRVAPNEIVLETPYIKNNIKFTRFGYGLDRIEEREFPALENLSKDSIQKNDITIKNIRLWDSEPLLETYKQLQQIRTYYDFKRVNNDRYFINGEYRQVMISPRELSSQNLPSRIWINEHLTYTHGYGITLGPVSRVSQEGLPEFFIKDIPPVSTVDIKVTRPEIYYGEAANDYVIVNTKALEFDYPLGDENKYATYKGKGGVPLSSFLEKVLFAFKFKTLKILLSNDLTSESRIMYYRNIVDRVKKIAPFILYDRNPYMVISDEGRLFWMIDGYTTTDRVPYSNPLRGVGNYIRNSVKTVIDVYNGSVDFYVSDEKDPLIKSYSKIFPGLFKTLGEMPADLKSHIRYPIDFFTIQSYIYATYHMQDPQIFYNKEDLWEIPRQGERRMAPYYTIMKLQGGEKEEFVLMIPFTPSKRDNMAAWLAARSDGPNYGRLIIYLFPKQKLIYGPRQIDARIDQNSVISQQITLWGQRGSKVIRGNLLVVPIDESLLYIEPLYLSAEKGSLPELRRVIVTYGNQLAMEENLQKALEKIFGKTLPSREFEKVEKDQGITTLKELIKKAQDVFNEAIKYQKEGDWSGYGEKIKNLQEVLKRMANQ